MATTTKHYKTIKSAMVKVPYKVGIAPPLHTEPFLILKENEDKTLLCVHYINGKLKTLTLPKNAVVIDDANLKKYYTIKVKSIETSARILGASKAKKELVGHTFKVFSVSVGYTCALDEQKRDTILVSANNDKFRFLTEDIEFIPMYTFTGITLPKDRIIRIKSEVKCINSKGTSIKIGIKGTVESIVKGKVESYVGLNKQGKPVPKKFKAHDILTIKLEDGKTIRSKSTKFKVI